MSESTSTFATQGAVNTVIQHDDTQSASARDPSAPVAESDSLSDQPREAFETAVKNAVERKDAFYNPTDNLNPFTIDNLGKAVTQQFQFVRTASGLSTVDINDKEVAVNWQVRFKRGDPFWSWEPTSETAKLHCETVVKGSYKEQETNATKDLKEVVIQSDFLAPTQDWATATRIHLRAGFAVAHKPLEPTLIEALIPLVEEKLLKVQTTAGDSMRYTDPATGTVKEPDYVTLHCDVVCRTNGGTTGSQSGTGEAPKLTVTVDATYSAYSRHSTPVDDVRWADWRLAARLTPKREWELIENPVRRNWAERWAAVV